MCVINARPFAPSAALDTDLSSFMQKNQPRKSNNILHTGTDTYTQNSVPNTTHLHIEMNKTVEWQTWLLGTLY